MRTGEEQRSNGSDEFADKSGPARGITGDPPGRVLGSAIGMPPTGTSVL